jgi:hypothetical protein
MQKGTKKILAARTRSVSLWQTSLRQLAAKKEIIKKPFGQFHDSMW